MKYIKTYENINLKKGDYVLLNNISDMRYKNEIYGIITNIVHSLNYPYQVSFPYRNNEQVAIKKTEIIRKLTSEEIEKIKIDLLSNKYNL